MKTNPNDPIMPSPELTNDGRIIGGTTGLTMRQYFAAMAIQGLADKNGLTYSDKAGQAVILADELIWALNRTASDNV